MPILTALDVQIGEHGVELRYRNKVGRHRRWMADTRRVFWPPPSAPRSPTRHTDPNAAKIFEVGLNAGFSAGIEAGNGQRNGNGHNLLVVRRTGPARDLLPFRHRHPFPPLPAASRLATGSGFGSVARPNRHMRRSPRYWSRFSFRSNASSANPGDMANGLAEAEIASEIPRPRAITISWSSSVGKGRRYRPLHQ